MCREIEQTLKRVNEGVADWDALWDKLEETEDPSQRDKIVGEMKKELKKLQRLREQVRGWAASGEVKDDSRLNDARKAVERQMERFKMLERELKIKQASGFSSEGLMRDSTDPLMVAKVHCADWINDSVSQLETQIEHFEADLEAMGPQKGSKKPPRMLELEGFIRRHQAHVTKLEQVLRLLENDQVTPDEVEGALHEGLEYYLSASTEADFVADDSMYDSLPLREVDDSIGKITAHTPRAGGKGKEFAEGEAPEGAPEGGKGKRGKAGKAGKGKASAGGEAGGKGAAAAKPAAVAPPPGLAPAPSSPSAATTPSAVNRSASFKAVAASGIKPPPPPPAGAAPAAAAAGGSPTKAAGGPETPAPTAQAGAAATPPVVQRARVVAAPASPPTAPAPAPLSAFQPAAMAADATSPPAPGILPTAPEAAMAAAAARVEPATEAAAPPLSPTSAARLGVFNEQMLLAAAAHQAEQQARLQAQAAGQRQMSAGLASSLPGSPAQPSLAASLPVVEVPAGLPPVALAPPAAGHYSGLARHTSGHSPLSALASAVSAAAAAAAAGSSAFSPVRQLSVEPAPSLPQLQAMPRLDLNAPAAPAMHAMPAVPAAAAAFGQDDVSPRSVRSSASMGAASSEAESRRGASAPPLASEAEFASAAAAAAVAGFSANGTPRAAERAAGPGIPTVLSFNHLQSQAESVLGLGAGAEALAPGGAGAQSVGGAGQTQEGGAAAAQGPWVPTLLDLQLLDASVQNRQGQCMIIHMPHPGDGDWTLQDGSVSAAGTPPPAQRPVVTPASYPNQVHPSLRREETFKKLSAETCFYAFYFQQGSRQQLFAANALKGQGWRFHSQFQAWFARQSQPRVVTETHEQGPLIYFDSLLHNVTPPSSGLVPQAPVWSGWCPRVSRPDFIFEYKFMEQEDTQAPSDA
ncbi:hypothetical protein ABPG75_005265 [Micractinium tetrahymenae]